MHYGDINIAYTNQSTEAISVAMALSIFQGLANGNRCSYHEHSGGLHVSEKLQHIIN